jgi:hypothetical protein
MNLTKYITNILNATQGAQEVTEAVYCIVLRWTRSDVAKVSQKLDTFSLVWNIFMYVYWRHKMSATALLPIKKLLPQL